MLSAIENLKETMKRDGHPDRFVNQYEFLHILLPDLYYMGNRPRKPGSEGCDGYGVFWRFREGQMGPLPVHDAEHTLIHDVCCWDEKLTRFPAAPEDPAYWAMLNDMAAKAVPGEQYATALYTQGIFERLHSLMGMEDAMIALYEEPEKVHELIDFLVAAELDFAKNIMDHVPGVRALLHHDDWGSNVNSFLSPAMFDEFITPAYKKIYGYWRERGVELIVHHSDSYAANLVPSMLEMGVDIWQGVFPENDIPKLVEQYGGRITFMGEIRTLAIDLPDVTDEEIAREVERACLKCKGPSFIPCLTAGLPISHFPGVYDKVSGEIRRMSRELF
jgi:hypothetical protein